VKKQIKEKINRKNKTKEREKKERKQTQEKEEKQKEEKEEKEGEREVMKSKGYARCKVEKYGLARYRFNGKVPSRTRYYKPPLGGEGTLWEGGFPVCSSSTGRNMIISWKEVN